MEKKLTRKYLMGYIFSIAIAFFLWMFLSYMLLSNGIVNTERPQYLIHSFEQYIVEEGDSIKISSEGCAILKRNNLWVQIIDSTGNVLCGYNAPSIAKNQYTIFEICEYVMNSDTMGNYTLFTKQVESGFGILMGCDSSQVSKMTVRLNGGKWLAIVESGIAFIVVLIIVGITSGYNFSKGIANPINMVIQNIKHLEKGEELANCSHDMVFQGVFESLFHLKETLDSVELKKEELEKQRKEWISNISHDMKTPLSSIKGYAEIMIDPEYSVNELEMRQYANTIGRNAAVMQGLIEELNLSRLLEDGGMQLKKEEIDVCSLLRNCVEEIPYEKDSVNINFSFKEEPIYVIVDEGLMRRCFSNLICNAIVHNNYNVDIVIRCQRLEKVIVEIEDNGYGLSQQEQDNIFNRYYRGGRASDAKGSGLGLAIAEEIIKNHQGSIGVISEVGNGCKFIVSI